MFDFMNMIGNYEDRKVAKYENGTLIIDTCAVTDSPMPYETGISHPLYNDGYWVIVETYTNIEDAKMGHEKWVGIMSKSELPLELRDVSEIGLASMLDAVDEDDWRVYKRCDV